MTRGLVRAKFNIRRFKAWRPQRRPVPPPPSRESSGRPIGQPWTLLPIGRGTLRLCA